VGIGLGYGTGFGAMAGGQGAFLVAGPTPLIAASLVAAADGKPTFVAAYLMACCALTILAVLLIKHRSVHD